LVWGGEEWNLQVSFLGIILVKKFNLAHEMGHQWFEFDKVLVEPEETFGF
jgi:hypothetical protein